MNRLTNTAGAHLTATSRPSYPVQTTAPTFGSGQTGVAKTPTGAPALPVAVWCHGLNSTPDEVNTQPGITNGIAAAGIPVVAPLLHAPSNPYANNVAMADIEEAVDHARVHQGAAPSGRFLIGQSGGGQSAFVNAARTDDEVLGICLLCPLTDPDGWFDLNAGGIVQTGMNNAYSVNPSGGWKAHVADRDPLHLADELTGIPVCMFYGSGIATTWADGATTGDGIIPSSTITDMAAALGPAAEARELPNVGHFVLGTAVAAASFLRFLAPLAGIDQTTVHLATT